MCEQKPLVVLATVGDINPLEHGGGRVYVDAQDGYLMMEYTPGIGQGLTDDGNPNRGVRPLRNYELKVYRWYFEKEWPSWAEIHKVKRWADLPLPMNEDETEVKWEEIDVQGWADIHVAIAGYYGFDNYDNTPLVLTIEEAEETWR